MPLKEGMQLTLNCEIIGMSGLILLEKGQTVTVDRFDIKEGFWGRRSGIWYEDELRGVVLNERPGSCYSPDIFEEFKNK